MKEAILVKLRKAMGLMEEANSIVNECADEARDIYDEKSERWQNSDAGSGFDNETNIIESVRDSMNEAVENLGGLEGLTG